MLVDTPEVEKATTSKRSSQFLENLDIGEAESHPSSNEKRSHEQRISAYLRHENGHARTTSNGSALVDRSPNHSMTSQHSRNFSRPSGDKPSPSERPRPSFMSAQDPRTDSNSPGHTVARADIKASAEKILYTFILPGSEREIVLPESILNRITHSIEEEGRDDPEVFDDAKDYVFQAMERDAFPGFLQAKALGNLVPLSVLIRIVLGLCSLMAGFWSGFYMILRNIPRHMRCWVSLILVATCL
jgi:Regulator of G protein signaling domain